MDPVTIGLAIAGAKKLVETAGDLKEIVSGIDNLLSAQEAKPRKKKKRNPDGTFRIQEVLTKEQGKRYNIWCVNTGIPHSTQDKIAYEHPPIFPEELANDHILSWSNKGDLVYDCFMGSGTTAKMSILNNRNWIGSELSNEYCNITEERIKKAWKEKIKEK